MAHKFSYALAPAANDASAPGGHALIDGVNLFSGISSFRDAFGAVTNLEEDLLHFASAVFAADRASPRGQREDYRRFIDLRIPVNNFDRFVSQGSKINQILRRLSQDVWKITFLPKESGSAPIDNPDNFEPLQGSTLLFSGGLDSLSAAVEFGIEATPLLLSSHITRNPATDGAQRELYDLLVKSGFNVEHRHFFVSSKDGGPTNLQHQLEPSQRTRSMVFLTLAVLAARRTGRIKVISMAENGQMAIHLPLSSARVGAFSTHTAHPAVLAACQEFFCEILNYPIEINNPYVYKTKAEVVQPLFKSLPSSIPISTSCWKNSRPMAGGARHCGECVPCLVRRIALQSNGSDSTAYAADMFSVDVASLPPDHEGRRNLVELCEFATRFHVGGPDISSEFPELISPYFDDTSAIDMYRRFSQQCRAVVAAIPKLSWLMP